MLVLSGALLGQPLLLPSPTLAFTDHQIWTLLKASNSLYCRNLPPYFSICSAQNILREFFQLSRMTTQQHIVKYHFRAGKWLIPSTANGHKFKLYRQYWVHVQLSCNMPAIGLSIPEPALLSDPGSIHFTWSRLCLRGASFPSTFFNLSSLAHVSVSSVPSVS